MTWVRKWPIFSAIAVAVAATVLTSEVRAQQDPPPAAPSASADSAIPLALRAGKALALAQEPPHAGLGWKVVAVMVILGGAAFYLRKRLQPARVEGGQLHIVRRAAIGIRSELLIVNVEGQRLLIGVTPHTIQSLAVLDGDDVVAQPVSEGSVQERFAAMLKTVTASDVTGRDDTVGHRAEPPEATEELHVAGQARGLLALRRRG